MRAPWLALALVGCGNDRVPVTEARGEFPDLARLYEGDHGLYRGCGPNGNVCHNGSEFPSLDSIGAIRDAIGEGCNQKRDQAETIDNQCERAGDLLEIALPDGTREAIEIAYVAAVAGTGDPARSYSLVLRRAPTSFSVPQAMPVTRAGVVVTELGGLVRAATLDPADPTGRSITLTMFDDPGNGQYDLGGDVSRHLARAGVPGAPDSLRVGDPNRDGVFGAELGASLIQPGAPERSYLLRRLTDPAAGPLMPRANCCYWTKPALRALWCWVAGLQPDATNALEPIDYDHCPPLPAIELDYPDPGPGCETSGLCPITAVTDGEPP